MTPKCEVHDEIMDSIHDTLREIKESLKNGSSQFLDMEKRKLGWGTFTWVVSVIMIIWLACQGVIWNEVKSVGSKVIKMDKSLAVHVGSDPDAK